MLLDGRNVTWKIHAERTILLGWGRALLLQIAHPLVAAGVSDHTQFQASPYGGVQRLRRTLDAMLALSFGTYEEAVRVAGRIKLVHDHVHGRLGESAGIFPSGTPYSAHDPALLRWVHATLLDSFLLTYERFIGPLTPEEKNQYCAEASAMEQLMGIPDGYLPRDREELASYVDAMRASGQLAVADTARTLAQTILSPDALWALGVAGSLNRVVTVGLLPPDIRAAYGFRWTAAEALALRATAATVRRSLPLLPAAVRYWSAARDAIARVETSGVSAGTPYRAADSEW